MRPRLLDLFCGAGGAGKGYADAGFEVVGVDITSQPDYPFEFYQGDALEVLRILLSGGTWQGYTLADFAAIHASPPCQAHSTLRHAAVLVVTPDKKGKFVLDLVEPTRMLLLATGLPYVIENVMGAPLRDPIMLCGSTLGLGAGERQLRRHRLFECSFPMMQMQCQHRGEPVGVYGTGGGGQMTRGYKGTTEEYREAMEMPWASRAGIAQAIPPAYTEHIGEGLLAATRRMREAA